MTDAAIVAMFLARYRADTESGKTLGLEDYQTMFRGYEDVVAREFAEIQEREGPSAKLNLDAPPSSQRWMGPFRILEEIGRGGQGEVYLAEDPRLNRKVALKVLRGLGSFSESVLRRFRREAEVTARLQHPGICTVYETAVADGVAYIAMRYVAGKSLAQEVADAGISGAGGSGAALPGRDGIRRTVALINQAALALHAAHEAGVVHRDIKPGNIIVSTNGDPVIVDFGLAADLSDDRDSLSRTGDTFGTPAYLSPEQLQPGDVRTDRRTDVWSLGVTLYECVTLRRPFEAPTRERLYQAILTKEPLNVRTLNPSVPKDLGVVIETALAKDRDRRYQTTLDLAEDLRRVQMHEPILAKPVGSLVRVQRWSRRNPALAAAVAGLFAVLAIGLVVALFLLGQRDRALGEKARALDDVTTERNEKTVALSEKSAALSDYDRLGDMSRLQRLKAEANALWPCEPAKAPAMSAWVKQGAELEGRLTGHRAVLERLRASAGLLPYTAEDRAADLAKHAAEQDQRAKLRAERENLVAAVSEAESRAASQPTENRATASAPASRATSRPSVGDLRARLAKIDAEIVSLDAIVHERLTWRFGAESEQFKHDTTETLVTDLTAFVDPDPKKGLLADVRDRLAFAESIEHETIGKYEAEWTEAIGSIADKHECPKYNGLEIKRQLGLIPIGKDPASGLWEFAHVQTATPGTDPIPTRDQAGRLVVTESMGLIFVLLPGGAFKMGAIRPRKDQAPTDPNVDPEAAGLESPVTEVTLDPFFLSKYEMTQGQWLRLVGWNRSEYGPGANFCEKVVDLRHPIEHVAWGDCDLWMKRLGLILPTEAQWEYGARAGTTTPRWTGLGKDGLSRAANLLDVFCRGDGGLLTSEYEKWDDGYMAHAPAGAFAPNPFGLHDVLGNVFEWCQDWFGFYGATAKKGDGLRTPSAPRRRVARGGSWGYGASSARSAFRYAYTPENYGAGLGLRPARSLRND